MQLTVNQRAVAKALLPNSSTSWWGGSFGNDTNAKHNLFYDFGYPQVNALRFEHFYTLWKRNGLAHALCTQTVDKTWQTMPVLCDSPEQMLGESPLEKEVRQHFSRIRFWQWCKQVDERSLVGAYSGMIFQLADGKPYSEPVEFVPGGVQGIISAIPAWEGQLMPSRWDTDVQSPNYGRPQMFHYTESAVEPGIGKIRGFDVHPDRVFIWSSDGTLNGLSRLEPCYNALLDAEKIRGAGGEGFWKNAKAQPVLEAEEDVDFNQLATMLGTDIEGLPDALDEVVSRWAKGFDVSLILQQMKAKTLEVSLPSPEHFFKAAVQDLCAAWPIPQKVLVGMQTGERASSEDDRAWSLNNMSRRANETIPNIMQIVNRFESWGILPERDWTLHWDDLTAPTLTEQLTIAEKMGKVNQTAEEDIFTAGEIREVSGYLPEKNKDA